MQELPDNIFSKKDSSQENIPDKEKPWHRNKEKLQKFSGFLNKLIGPAITITINFVVLAILGSQVLYNGSEQKNEISVSVKEVTDHNIDNPLEFVEKFQRNPEREKTQQQQQKELETEIASTFSPETNTDISRPSSNSSMSQTSNIVSGTVSYCNSGSPLTLSVKSKVGAGSGNSDFFGTGGLGGFNSSSSALSGREGEKKTKNLSEYGGNRKTEEAVEKALKWLAEHQNDDGSWGRGSDTDLRLALSGLAVLAFLAHSETSPKAEYNYAAVKGIRRLLDYSKARNITINPDGFGHALLTYALAEAYSMTGIPMLKEELDKRTAIIIQRINKLNTSNYADSAYKSSLSGWNYQALKASFTAGVMPDGMDEAISKSIESVAEGLRKDGKNINRGINVSIPQAPVDTTGIFVKLFCLQIFGEDKGVTADKYMQKTVTHENGALLKCDWKKAGNWPLYTWYYQTQSIFMGYSGKGDIWKKWNFDFTTSFLENQEKDGSWTSPAHKYVKGEEGETAKAFQYEENLSVYSTALCTLMLEVYYRYLPTYYVKFDRKKPSLTQLAEKDDIPGLVIE